MHKTLIVKGMMCPHCEAHCRESLEKVDGVVSAKCDHNACTAEVELSRVRIRRHEGLAPGRFSAHFPARFSGAGFFVSAGSLRSH